MLLLPTRRGHVYKIAPHASKDQLASELCAWMVRRGLIRANEERLRSKASSTASAATASGAQTSTEGPRHGTPPRTTAVYGPASPRKPPPIPGTVSTSSAFRAASPSAAELQDDTHGGGTLLAGSSIVRVVPMPVYPIKAGRTPSSRHLGGPTISDGQGASASGSGSGGEIAVEAKADGEVAAGRKHVARGRHPRGNGVVPLQQQVKRRGLHTRYRPSSSATAPSSIECGGTSEAQRSRDESQQQRSRVGSLEADLGVARGGTRTESAIAAASDYPVNPAEAARFRAVLPATSTGSPPRRLTTHDARIFVAIDMSTMLRKAAVEAAVTAGRHRGPFPLATVMRNSVYICLGDVLRCRSPGALLRWLSITAFNNLCRVLGGLFHATSDLASELRTVLASPRLADVLPALLAPHADWLDAAAGTVLEGQSAAVASAPLPPPGHAPTSSSVSAAARASEGVPVIAPVSAGSTADSHRETAAPTPTIKTLPPPTSSSIAIAETLAASTSSPTLMSPPAASSTPTPSPSLCPIFASTSSPVPSPPPTSAISPSPSVQVPKPASLRASTPVPSAFAPDDHVLLLHYHTFPLQRTTFGAICVRVIQIDPAMLTCDEPTSAADESPEPEPHMEPQPLPSSHLPPSKRHGGPVTRHSTQSMRMAKAHPKRTHLGDAADRGNAKTSDGTSTAAEQTAPKADADRAATTPAESKASIANVAVRDDHGPKRLRLTHSPERQGVEGSTLPSDIPSPAPTIPLPPSAPPPSSSPLLPLRPTALPTVPMGAASILRPHLGVPATAPSRVLSPVLPSTALSPQPYSMPGLADFMPMSLLPRSGSAPLLSSGSPLRSPPPRLLSPAIPSHGSPIAFLQGSTWAARAANSPAHPLRPVPGSPVPSPCAALVRRLPFFSHGSTAALPHPLADLSSAATGLLANLSPLTAQPATSPPSPRCSPDLFTLHPAARSSYVATVHPLPALSSPTLAAPAGAPTPCFSPLRCAHPTSPLPGTPRTAGAPCPALVGSPSSSVPPISSLSATPLPPTTQPPASIASATDVPPAATPSSLASPTPQLPFEAAPAERCVAVASEASESFVPRVLPLASLSFSPPPLPPTPLTPSSPPLPPPVPPLPPPQPPQPQPPLNSFRCDIPVSAVPPPSSEPLHQELPLQAPVAEEVTWSVTQVVHTTGTTPAALTTATADSDNASTPAAPPPSALPASSVSPSLTGCYPSPFAMSGGLPLASFSASPATSPPKPITPREATTAAAGGGTEGVVDGPEAASPRSAATSPPIASTAFIADGAPLLFPPPLAGNDSSCRTDGIIQTCNDDNSGGGTDTLDKSGCIPRHPKVTTSLGQKTHAATGLEEERGGRMVGKDEGGEGKGEGEAVHQISASTYPSDRRRVTVLLGEPSLTPPLADAKSLAQYSVPAAVSPATGNLGEMQPPPTTVIFSSCLEAARVPVADAPSVVFSPTARLSRSSLRFAAIPLPGLMGCPSSGESSGAVAVTPVLTVPGRSQSFSSLSSLLPFTQGGASPLHAPLAALPPSPSLPSPPRTSTKRTRFGAIASPAARSEGASTRAAPPTPPLSRVSCTGPPAPPSCDGVSSYHSTAYGTATQQRERSSS